MSDTVQSIQNRISKVEEEIKKIEDEIEEATKQKEDLEYWRGREMHLRKDKEQLRKKEEQLREERLILLRSEWLLPPEPIFPVLSIHGFCPIHATHEEMSLMQKILCLNVLVDPALMLSRKSMLPDSHYVVIS